MRSASAKPVTITVEDEQRVSGLLQIPSRPSACYVMAHGAGAGMTHPFMAGIAAGLSESRAGNRPRGCDRSIPPCSQACFVRRRQVIWRPHDFASTSSGASIGGARTDLSGIPHSFGGATFSEASRASLPSTNSDAVFARHSRPACGHEPSSKGR